MSTELTPEQLDKMQRGICYHNGCDNPSKPPFADCDAHLKAIARHFIRKPGSTTDDLKEAFDASRKLAEDKRPLDVTDCTPGKRMRLTRDLPGGLHKGEEVTVVGVHPAGAVNVKTAEGFKVYVIVEDLRRV